MTAEAADGLGADKWRTLAEQEVARLAADSGEHRDSLLRSAERRLG